MILFLHLFCTYNKEYFYMLTPAGGRWGSAERQVPSSARWGQIWITKVVYLDDTLVFSSTINDFENLHFVSRPTGFLTTGFHKLGVTIRDRGRWLERIRHIVGVVGVTQGKSIHTEGIGIYRWNDFGRKQKTVAIQWMLIFFTYCKLVMKHSM